jgi:hypothetical protein
MNDRRQEGRFRLAKASGATRYTLRSSARYERRNVRTPLYPHSLTANACYGLHILIVISDQLLLTRPANSPSFLSF